MFINEHIDKEITSSTKYTNQLTKTYSSIHP